MTVIRWILGKIILLINALTKPRGVVRDSEAQRQVNEQTTKLSLYQFEACPFCVKVRRANARLSLDIKLRDAKSDPWRAELLEQGGSPKVPCLRIEQPDGSVDWMYESSDIVNYLEQRFAPKDAVAS